MEMIFEILLDLIIDGSLQAVQDKMIPLFLRIAAAAVLLTVYGGFVGFILYLGIHNKNVLLIIFSIGLLIFFGFGFLKAYKNRSK